MAHHRYRGIAQLVEQRSPKPRAEGSSPSAPAKTKRHLRVSFLFCFKAEGLEPRNSKVLALLTVNSPVDCLRIELIINSLPKKAPNFRCFFPLFTLYYGDFTYFSHIDKITAHGLFRMPSFHFHTGFYSLCEFIYADLILFGNSFGIIFLSLSSFPSLIASP